jgi:hypothetical protein
MVALEIYWTSIIGKLLTETLDEMVESGKLAPELAPQVALGPAAVRRGSFCLAVNAN